MLYQIRAMDKFCPSSRDKKFCNQNRGGHKKIISQTRTGYSLKMLRDLEQMPLNTTQSKDGYPLPDSYLTGYLTFFELKTVFLKCVGYKDNISGKGEKR